jgi:glyoxylase-like metal-dependent hydrolase (beta-lactamase superfamily II)
VEQDSLYKVITQKKQLSGPPVYFTTDWQAAWESVKKLKQLDPALVITGHGVPMLDDELTDGLTALADDFERIAIPEYGHYVRDVH